MSTSGNFFNEPESISGQTSTRSEAISKTGTLERFFNEQQSSSEEEEGSEEETESDKTESESEESDNQVNKPDNQVEEELTEGLEGLHLGEETESEEETETNTETDTETKSDETDNEMSANQGTGQAPGSQVLVQMNGQMGKSLVPDPGFFDGE
jgi:hypothetical protein